MAGAVFSTALSHCLINRLIRMSTAATTHTITVNGETREVPSGHALTDLLRSLDIDPEYATGVAVAINEEVIPRDDWTETVLDEDDTVEVIRAQQGG